MSRIEQYIRDNRNLFDEEPEAGHFGRLQQKVNRRYQKITVLRWSVSIAASIAVLLSVWQYGTKQNEILMCENASDIKICYLDKMMVVAGEIETLIVDFDQWDRQDVMTEVQNLIEATTDGYFENELPKELSDDMLKTILAEYYQRNLDGLQLIAKVIIN